ncbi:class I SAM-dependent methyltransferase [Polynucleobacter difficilis]|uniref:class I SAM-dependent methyltransferase n=1 Tax=Polynucleobacter difficilis TaxID=556054 RepID=UPI000D3472C0|nr:class I SAM-dependent methyltransferase [Polynucleobacter difficilis]
MRKNSLNEDNATIKGFGDEWERFDQSDLDKEEAQELFQRYFAIFPWWSLPDNAIGFDMGCGSGRWALLVAPKVFRLHCIDPSLALHVAKKNLINERNCTFHAASVGDEILEENSMDFGYSLGVLHHIPDTQAGINACVRLLKPGAPFLLYLYYAFDGRPFWFRSLWKISDFFRHFISRLPYGMRYLSTQLFAFLVYLPLARLCLFLEKLGVNEDFIDRLPLCSYRKSSFYTMRTDALDRFGTKLEKRFSKQQIEQMMTNGGLINISFSENVPYWCAVGYKGG